MEQDIISLAEARKLLKQAVETQGRDFVYNRNPLNAFCYNVPLVGEVAKHYCGGRQIPEDDPRTKTGCLVGTALRLSGRSIPWDSPSSWPAAVSWFAHYLDDGAMYYFQQAQRRQDSGGTWGDAFDDAEQFIIEQGWVK